MERLSRLEWPGSWEELSQVLHKLLEVCGRDSYRKGEPGGSGCAEGFMHGRILRTAPTESSREAKGKTGGI